MDGSAHRIHPTSGVAHGIHSSNLVLKGATMEKGMCIGSIVIAVLMLVVFLADIIAGWPFSGATPEDKSSPFVLVDIGGILGSLVVGYLGFNAYRDAK